jgi:glycosyltransferase involved in cell wall biosynthesis
MLDKPLVSVLMTSYNRQNYIGEAIESVIASSYTNWELIIVDDASEDSTVAIAKQFEMRDQRIKVYINPFNLGDYPNRNKAATYAKGKYIKYLDSDDTIMPWGLEYCVSQMEDHPDAGLGLILINPTTSQASIKKTSEEIIREHFFKRPYLNIGPTGSIIRRDIFELNQGFDTRFKMASDNYFNLQMALSAPVILLTKFFFHYRSHDGQELNNADGYLVYNYLYSKDFFDRSALPLRRDEITFLKSKLQKRHSVNLLRHILKTSNFRKVSDVMRKTDYSFINFIKGFFY